MLQLIVGGLCSRPAVCSADRVGGVSRGASKRCRAGVFRGVLPNVAARGGNGSVFSVAAAPPMVARSAKEHRRSRRSGRVRTHDGGRRRHATVDALTTEARAATMRAAPDAVGTGTHRHYHARSHCAGAGSGAIATPGGEIGSLVCARAVVLALFALSLSLSRRVCFRAAFCCHRPCHARARSRGHTGRLWPLARLRECLQIAFA